MKDYYKLSKEALFNEFKTDEKGLSQEDAKKRLLEYGKNIIAGDERVSKIKILIHQFTSPLIYILLVAGFITLFMQEYIDSAVIFIVVIINAIIGFSQEYKAEESVRSLKKMVVARTKVIRDGIEKEINSEELVPGDIVVLASGMRVPADVRLIHAIELKIDEAMLTGESLPAEKISTTLKEDNLTYGDQRNMAFMGTIVVSGRAKGVVVATGQSTVLGKIAKDVKDIGIVKAPLQEKIDKFAKSIGILVLFASIILFVVGILIGESVKDMFMTAVASAVATIPEGLPIVVTIAMAVGVSRMAKNNAIIRKLPAVETLGSTTVIGSDKTGTLTKNEMTVKFIYDGKDLYEVEGSGYSPDGNILFEGMELTKEQKSKVIDILRIGLLCNESNIYEENGDYKVDGDPTEGALIVSAMKMGMSKENESELYKQLAIIPFESERGYMATLHSHRGKKIIFVKGAPERVLDMCIKDNFGNTLDKKSIMHISSELAKKGMRVLAFAYKESDMEPENFICKEIEKCDVTTGLIFAGLQAMIDPPRPEVIDAIKGCKKAGIRVVMITGDHALTAKAIAKELGITDKEPEVITGKELESMDDDELFHKVKNISVYARVSPHHKLRVVQQLKRNGEIVAVTGDGVNDAPALKAAHIGVAMGKSGTDVAKEASDMVLTDDNFASIFHAVREGRIVFDNIRKVTFFLIPTGVAAILSIIMTIILGLPIPYVPAQLLWINIVTNGLQDVALAFEPGEPNVINRLPRDPKEGIMSKLLIQRTIIVGFLISLGVVFNYLTVLKDGYSLEKARTVAVTTMVFFQFFQAWNSKSEYESIFKINPLNNPFLFISIISAFFAQLAVLYVPFLQWIFRTQPITANEWIQILIVSLSVIVVVEIDKFIRRLKMKNV